MLFRLSDESLEPVGRVGFAEAGVYERTHLQRLLREDISPIADDVMVIAEEFAAFSNANRRIDLLCLSRSGELVVVELKRTQDGGHMELQALRYAAFVSTMTYEQVVDAHAAFGEETGLFDPSSAEDRIADFLGALDEVPALGARVRVVLVSADFGIELTSTVLWLNSFEGLDVRCVRLHPYRLDDQLVLDVQQVIPLPEAADYQIRVRHREAQAQSAASAASRDLTRFVIRTPQGETAPLAKRHAAHAMVAAVLDAGVEPAALSTVMAPMRWRSVAGEVTGLDLRAALQAEQPDIDLRRYFSDAPFHSGGRTWVLHRGWGRSTERYLERLAALVPSGTVSFLAVPGS